VSARGGVSFSEDREEAGMPHKEDMNWAKRVEEIEFEGGREASAKRRAREDKRDAAKERQIRKNREKEWAVFWQGGAPQ
jgi:hypothetical protein